MNQEFLIYGLPFFLTMDIFFLSIAGGVTLQPYQWRVTAKVSAAFIVSQLLAGAIGLILASLILPLIIGFSKITAAILIGFFGSKMMQEAVKVKNEQRTFLLEDSDILLPLSLAGSLNTLVIFLGMGFLQLPYKGSLITLFFSILILSQLGLFIGSHYRPLRTGRYSKFAGGLVMIILIILNFVL